MAIGWDDALLMFGPPLLSSIVGSDASRSAAQTQASAADRAAELQWKMFEQARADVEPWRAGGRNALNVLMGGMGLDGNVGQSGISPGMFTKPFEFSTTGPFADPSYLWRKEQGEKALLSRRNLLGGLDSGGTAKALMDYNQGLASEEYGLQSDRWDQYMNNLYSRFADISGTGANVASGIGGAGMNTGGRAGELGLQAAIARSAGTMGQANALSQGLQGGVNNYLLSRIIQGQQPQPRTETPFAWMYPGWNEGTAYGGSPWG